MGLGLLSVITLALGLALATKRVLGERLIAMPDAKQFVFLASFAGFAIPALLRAWVLGGAPVVDDEAVYRFAAQVLLEGQLAVPPPPGELFWDRVFFVNDGRWFTQYFPGWPALMAPFLIVDLDGYANALYAGATIPAVYGIGRRLYGEVEARWCALLFLCAPLLAFAASTQMSHTSCVFTNAWTLYFYLKTREVPGHVRNHVAFAALFCVGIFVRPLTTLGLSFPFVILWAWTQIRSGNRNTMGVLAFLATSLTGAALFLLVNSYYTGSPLRTAYQAAQDYAIANDFRFSHLVKGTEIVQWVNLQFDVRRGMYDSLVSLYRFNVAALGWPSSLIIGLFGLWKRTSRLPAVSFVSFLAFHYFMRHSGVDTFGPPHHVELTLPLVFLTTAGARQLHELFVARSNWRPMQQLSPYIVIAMVVVSTFGYSTLRAANLARIAEATRLPLDALDYVRSFYRLEDEKLIIFRYGHYAHPCLTPGTRHFVFWPPAPSPDLSDEVLWVNHLSLAADLELVARLNDERTPLISFWLIDEKTGQCQFRIDKLEKVGAQIPNSQYVTDDYQFTEKVWND